MLQLAVVFVGFATEFAAWRRVARGRSSVWSLMVVVFGVNGGVAALVRPPISSGRVAVVVAATVGLGIGFALYLATRGFVALASGWPAFRAQVAGRYARARVLPLPAALALSLLIAVPGEELFWRGLAEPRLQASMPVLSGPALAWVGYVIANAASGSLPFIAGAIVGGAVWTALAVWTRGVLASLICHMAWTGLMLAMPPGAGREMMPA